MDLKRISVPLVVGTVLFAAEAVHSEQGSDSQRMLGSVDQSERDAGASKLRGSFQCVARSSWDDLASLAKPGTPLTKLKTELTKSNINLMDTTGTACGGGSCSTGYRVDDCYVLHVAFATRDDSIISSNVHEHLKHIWVEPPKGYSGKWVVYFANGMKSHEIDYEEGRYSGLAAYYPNGQLNYRQTYNAKGIDGEEIGYFRSGKVKYRAYHKDGQSVGKWIWFDENGKVRSERQYPE